MKNCPACGTQYSDDTLQFCLQDGTPLTGSSQPGGSSGVFPSNETVTRVRSAGEVSDPRFMGSEVTRVGSLGSSVPPAPASTSSKTAITVGITAVVMIVLFAIIGVGALILMNIGRSSTISNLPNKNSGPTNFFNLNSPTASPTPAVTPTRAPSTPTPTPASTPVSTPTPRVLAHYPGTTRLKFSRGAFTTSFSGEINPGDSRSLVLACRYGQTLSASLSGGGCVTFRGGGTSTRFGTSGGDNFLTVTNTCSQVAHFSVSITVI